MEQNFIDGVVLSVDKELEWTSFDVVNKLRYQLRRLLNIKKIKVGHAGTLDPLATGLLIICTGKMTKRIVEFQELEKEYTGVFTLGATTPSYDLETTVGPSSPTDHLSDELIREASQQFLGTIDQTPPDYSAVKVGGKRAYELARKGIEAKINSRKVTISEFELGELKNNEVPFRIVCSKGTYIRSLARDLGDALGCGAYLSALRRTRIGDLHVENAMRLDEIIESIGEDKKERNR